MTGRVEFYEGFPINIPNNVPIIGNDGDFYVSYNDRDIETYGSDTTALVNVDMTRFLILNGNHIAQYKGIIDKGGSYEDCIDYFNRVNEKSRFSD